jgi:formylglycine-generating enzyme required for sulfatase activity/serine/threonine protein kinase
MQYDVFIAHPSEHKEAARAVAAALRELGLRPFVDEQLEPGTDWMEALRRIQEGCRASVVLWAHDLDARPYLRDEVRTALIRNARFGHLVFPVWVGAPGTRLPYGLDAFQAATDVDRVVVEVARQLGDPVHAREQEIERLELLLGALKIRGEPTTDVAARIRTLRRERRVEDVPTRLGKWEILEPIGKGGFATVYLARPIQGACNLRVAIKVLHADRSTHADSVSRFCSGSVKMQELHDHPGVVDVIDWATPDMKQEHGHVFFVMEHIDGEDLQKRVTGGLPVEEGIEVVLAVADALTHAHDRGRVHRDVKPANILVGRDGRAKVTDFDLVLAEESTQGTRTGAALGTLLYAAPEQLESAGRVDQRADVYGLGMVLAFVLAGGKINPREAMFRRERFLAGLPCSDPMREALRLATDPEEERRTADMRSFVAAVRAAIPQAAEEPAEPHVPPNRMSPDTRPTSEVSTAPPLLHALQEALDERRWPDAVKLGRRLAERAEREPRSVIVWSAETWVRSRAAIQQMMDGPNEARMLAHALVSLFRGVEGAARRAAGSGGGPPGEVIHELAGLRFVYIPRGTFVRGRQPEPPMNSADAQATQSSDLPRHEVTLSPFAMAVTPVTQGQWRALAGALNTTPSRSQSRKRAEALPITDVSWYDAVRWCNALSEKDGRRPAYEMDPEVRRVDSDGYRLPTEAEWEYACRAGTTSAFWGGEREADLDRVAWYGRPGSFGGNSRGTTWPVGLKPPNPWGLYDMHGNVWEWCDDWMGTYTAGALTDPSGPAHGDKRVVRGGSCRNSPDGCRSAFRIGNPPSDRDGVLGFRVVLPLIPPAW